MLPEILRRFRNDDLEIILLRGYSRIDDFVVQIILLRFFPKKIGTN